MILTISGANGQISEIYPDDRPLVRHIWSRITDDAPILRGAESVEFSPNGKWVASCSKFGYNIMLWRVLDGTLVWETRSPSELEIIYFSPDGKLLASGGEDLKVRIWDVASGEMIRELDHDHGLDGLSWSHDGKTLASGSEGGDLYLWDTHNWSLTDRVNTGTVINSIQFTSDDQYILTGGNDKHPDHPAHDKGMRIGTVKLWKAQDLSLVKNYAGHEKSVKSVRLSPDEKLIASGSFDKTIKVWDRESGKLLHTIPVGYRVEAVEFSPDTHFLYTGGDFNNLLIYSTKTYEKIMEIECAPVEYIDFTENGRMMATAQEKSGIISIYTFEHKKGLSSKFVNSLLSNPDLNKNR